MVIEGTVGCQVNHAHNRNNTSDFTITKLEANRFPSFLLFLVGGFLCLDLHSFSVSVKGQDVVA